MRKVFYILAAPVAAFVIMILLLAAVFQTAEAVMQWRSLLPLLGGAVAMWAINHKWGKRSNFGITKTLAHEMAHTILAIICLHRVSEIRANTKSGYIMRTGMESMSSPFITLAPYYLPYATFLLFAFRLLITPEYLWIFDIVAGITLGFHICCFYEQTGSYQTDISKYPVFFSYAFIAFFHIINMAIILGACTFESNSGAPLNLHGSVWHLLCSAFDITKDIFNNLKSI